MARRAGRRLRRHSIFGHVHHMSN